MEKNTIDNNKEKNVFGVRLQALRNESGLTTTKLAAILKVPSSSISRWENGFNYPSIDTLRTVAKYFDVSTDYLLGIVNFPRAFHSESESYMRGEDSVSIYGLNEDEKMLIKSMIKVLHYNNKRS